MTNILRFTPRRKAVIAHPVLQGHLTEAEAEVAFGISKDELKHWLKQLAEHGIKGLKATGKKSC